MRLHLLSAALTLACLPMLGIGQDLIKPPISKQEQDLKFHQPPVKGMAASERAKAYADRLKLEATTQFLNVKWRNVGPEWQGGRVAEIASPLKRPDQLYVAFSTGGLWRTEDAGITWTPLFDHESSFGIGDFAVSKDGKTIWLGSGEPNSQRTSYAGTGIFKSTDAGATWVNVGLPESHHIGRVLIDPRDENTVWVAAMGHLYSQNDERGVYKTIDGGKTWKQILKLDDHTGVIDLSMDPRDSRVVYASAWDRDRRAWDFREGGPGSAVYKAKDGGSSWEKLGGLPSGVSMGRAGLALAASKPSRLYAFVDNQAPDPDSLQADEHAPSGELTLRRFLNLNEEMIQQVDKKKLERFFRRYLPDDKVDDVLANLKDKKVTAKELISKMQSLNPNAFHYDIKDAEIYRSDDGGKTWIKPYDGKIGSHGGYYWNRTFVNPRDPDDVWTTGVGLLRSKNAGKTWDYVAEDAHGDFHVVWFDPKNAKHIIVGSDGGLYESGDNGKTFRPINNIPVGQFTTIAVDDKKPYNIIGGLQDNGTMKGPSTYVYGKSDPRDWQVIGVGGDGSAVAIDPRGGGDIVYTAAQFGEIEGLNQVTGEHWGAAARGEHGIQPRYNWVAPVVISTHHPDIIYVGSEKLNRSFNQGRKFEAISPDLTKNKPQGNVPHSTIKDISESPLQFGLVYVGTDDGNVKMTPDGGYQWIDIATPQPNKWVSRVVASKWDKATVYCSQSGYREDDFSAYLWKSTDFGKHWTSIVGNLPAETINVVREDPAHANILYVGTDLGVYVTFDQGQNWEALPGAIPHTPVHDIAIQARESEMAIATHARSVWVLSLNPLYKVAEVRKEDLHVWSPPDMERNPRWGYFASPVWIAKPDEFDKITVEFFTKTPGKATIKLKAADGTVLREQTADAVAGYNGVEFSLVLAPGDPKAKPVIVSAPKKVEEALADPLLAARPKFPAAGDYTIEVSLGGKLATAKWKLKVPETH